MLIFDLLLQAERVTSHFYNYFHTVQISFTSCQTLCNEGQILNYFQNEIIIFLTVIHDKKSLYLPHIPLKSTNKI